MTAPWAVLLVGPRREDRPWQNNVLANDSVCSAAMAALSAKEVAANRCVLANSLCGDTCRGGAADKKREWKKAALKFAYVFPFGNRLRWRVLSKLVGKKNFCRGPPGLDFRGALGPPDGGGAITAGVQGTQSHAAASAAPIYCFHLLAFIFASHISCQQHPRPGRPGHKTGSHWPPPPRRLEINIEGWRGGLEARRGGPGQGLSANAGCKNPHT